MSEIQIAFCDIKQEETVDAFTQLIHYTNEYAEKHNSRPENVYMRNLQINNTGDSINLSAIIGSLD